jgi:hypothetical protein
MRIHTNDFKEELKVFGRQIQGKIIYYPSYELITENGNNILTESDLQIISEQANYESATEIDEEDIFSISIIKNGNLLQSLMKEFDFETKEELNIGSVVNPQFGLLVNGEYEYLNYGNYIINSKEFNMDTETWSYICYDKMLFSMIKYRELSGVQYPITIKQYINLICNKIGLEFEDSQFVNQGQLIYEDLYKNRDVTYRDIFDEVSKIVAGNLMINDSDKLVIGYPTETNDTINEEYLKDTNVRMSEKIGVINSVAILDTDNNLEYIQEDTESIKTNEMTRITITNNLLALNGDTNTIALNILNKLNGLYYYANDLQTTGVCYYDYLDLFNVEARGNTYKCLLLNNEITITQGIEEHIFTEKLEEAQTSSNEYTTSVMTNKQIQFNINQQEGRIESKVEKDGVISAINQSAEEIQINADKLSFEGATIDMTADNVKIQGENLSIDSAGTITLNDNSAASSLSSETLHSAYIIESEDSVVRQGTTETLKFRNEIVANGRKAIVEDNWEYEGTTGGSTSGITERIYSQPQLILYSQNKDYDSMSETGTYQALNIGLVSGISYENINNGTTTTPLNITSTGNITCVRLTQTSKEENKKNFEKLTNAKDILNQVDIYKYNFKDEDDNVKKSIGFVIGDDFNYSQEITSENNDGANIYSMVSVLWQVVKEQQEEIKELKEMIKNGKY